MTHTRRSTGGYSQDGARKYRLISDPTQLFEGGYFTRHDLIGDNDKLQSWVVPGMVFRHLKKWRLYRATLRGLVEITEAEYDNL